MPKVVKAKVFYPCVFTRGFETLFDKPSLFVIKKPRLSFQPHLCVVSQDVNFDGVHFAEVCRKLELKYVIISQKAVDFFPPVEYRSTVRSTY